MTGRGPNLDLQQALLAGHADSKREAEGPRSAVRVETALPKAPETVVWPSAAGQNRPGNPEPNQTQLAAVHMAREDQIRCARGIRIDVCKSRGIM